MIEKKEVTIDAGGRSPGRIATEIAKILMGKTDADFERHTVASVRVKVVNAKGMTLSQKKRKSKVYTRYTGYPGGLRKMSMSEVIDKKGKKEVLGRAVYGMLPGNKLRAQLMKNLIIEE